MVFWPCSSSCFLIEAAVAAVVAVSTPHPASMAAAAIAASIFMADLRAMFGDITRRLAVAPLSYSHQPRSCRTFARLHMASAALKSELTSFPVSSDHALDGAACRACGHRRFRGDDLRNGDQDHRRRHTGRSRCC